MSKYFIFFLKMYLFEYLFFNIHFSNVAFAYSINCAICKLISMCCIDLNVYYYYRSQGPVIWPTILFAEIANNKFYLLYFHIIIFQRPNSERSIHYFFLYLMLSPAPSLSLSHSFSFRYCFINLLLLKQLVSLDFIRKKRSFFIHCILFASLIRDHIF